MQVGCASYLTRVQSFLPGNSRDATHGESYGAHRHERATGRCGRTNARATTRARVKKNYCILVLQKKVANERSRFASVRYVIRNHPSIGRKCENALFTRREARETRRRLERGRSSSVASATRRCDLTLYRGRSPRACASRERSFCVSSSPRRFSRSASSKTRRRF